MKEAPRAGGSGPTVELYGLGVSSLSFGDTVDWLLRRAEAGIPTNVVALNAGKVVALQGDSALRAAMEAADIIVPDGQSIVWASHVFGRSVSGRVNGTNLMMATLSRAAESGMKVFFLGGRQELLETMLARVRSNFGNGVVAGGHHGYFGAADEPRIIAEIQAAGAQFLYVGMSTPRKEIWVAENMDALGVPVVMGVGGSFDILAGVIWRAPVVMQRIGLEWLVRLVQEPGRLWRRYMIGNPRFIWITAREAFRRDGPARG